MEIMRAEIENFMAIGEASLHLNNRGLVLISGDNGDDQSASSNGAGKSSLADAICWCLFNETARGVTADGVVNRTRGKGTVVRVEMRVDGETYTVVRHRKHAIGKNSLRLIRGGVDVSKGTDAETQKIVEQILGCSQHVFRAAVYCGQESMPDLPGMSDKFLKLLVEEAAGINLLQQCHEIALDRVREAKADVEQALSAERVIAQQVVFIEETIRLTEKQREEWEVARAAEIERLEQEAAAAFEDALQIREGLARYDVPAIQAELQQIDEQLGDYRNRVNERRELEDKLSQANAAVARASATAEHARRDAERLLAALTDVENRVGKTCGECGKVYKAKDLLPAKELAATKVNEASNAHSCALEVVRSWGELQTNAQLEVNGYTLPDVSALTSRASGLQEQLREVLRIEAAIASGEDRYRINNERVVEWSNSINPYLATATLGETRLKEAQERQEQAAKDRQACEAKQALAEAVVSVYGPSGVRAHILDTVTPYLNERTSHYLGALSDGNISASWSTLSRTAKGELREKFSIAVSNSKGADGFAGFSGGEKRKTRLACALALQDLVASRASRPLRLFIGDEIDDALDPAGLERLMGILEEKARERGTVLVISHNDLADWIREQVTVRKVDGVAVVTGNLSEAVAEVAA